MARTLERVPVVKPGMASCLACYRANFRGGDNTCPIKGLRDSDGLNGRMRRSLAGEQFECGSFKALTRLHLQHRLGVETHKHRDRSGEGQGSLF